MSLPLSNSFHFERWRHQYPQYIPPHPIQFIEFCLNPFSKNWGRKNCKKFYFSDFMFNEVILVTQEKFLSNSASDIISAESFSAKPKDV